MALGAALEGGFQGNVVSELRVLASKHREVLAAERGANAEAEKVLLRHESSEFRRIVPKLLANYLLTQQALDIASK